MTDPDLRARFERVVEHHVLHGVLLPVEDVCGDRPEFAGPLSELVQRYLDVTRALDGEARPPVGPATPADLALPTVDGFRTVERIGGGGMGEVYKLYDLRLGRAVAAKVLRRDAVRGVADFLREARALALFSDPRIVSIFEFRADADPPVLIMELVEGFELGRIGPSLEFHQRARVLQHVCDAVDRAHRLGLYHRDLKPSNVMLDAELSPKILDFGLSTADTGHGHFRGTPNYLAPEVLDVARPIDARTDVFGLGAILYELLCGTPPFAGATDDEVLAAVRVGRVRLPVEIDPAVPEPLQAIALKALEHDPADRYPSARDMALDLARYLDGRPVLARPTRYASELGTRIRGHVQQIEEWQRLRLIYPHEAGALRSAYRTLEAREDDWIVESRVLSYSQIVLYLGAFFLMCGSLFYFGVHRVHEVVHGLARPFAVLALPFAGLNLAGRYLFSRDHQAVAVAFFLGGVALLPLFLLIVFHETSLWVVAENTPGQLLLDGSVSNRQLQVTILAALVWAGWLTLRTRTVALSTVLAALALLLTLAILGDFGLRGWIEDGRFDHLALHLLPLAAVYAAAGQAGERTGRPWLSRPFYAAAALVLVAALELLALDGRLFGYLHVSLGGLASDHVSDPLLLDTLAAMTLNGMVFYLTAWLIDRFGSELKKRTAWLLFTISPFAVLQPVGWLVKTGEYSRVFDWTYLALALVSALVSGQRQRRSFYYAGVVNSGIALWLIADHHEWFDDPWWAILLVVLGLAALAGGFALARRERRRRGDPGS